MPIDGLTGIASGVDTSAIVEKLMDFERQKGLRLGLRKAAVTARQTGLSDVASKVSALRETSVVFAALLGERGPIAAGRAARELDVARAGELAGGAGWAVARLSR